MKAEDEVRNVLTVYNSYAEMLGALESKRGAWASSHDPKKDLWAGGTWDEAYNLMLDGWDEPVGKIDAEVKERLAEAIRPMPMHDVAGGEVDIGAFLSGDPDCMIRLERANRPSPVVRILIDRIAHCNVPQQRMEAVGRNLFTVVEALRIAGIPAEVWVSAAVSNYQGTYCVRFKIQEAGRPLDVSRLAYWVIHPTALRRAIFALMECESGAVRQAYAFTKLGTYSMPQPGYGGKEFDEVTPSGQASDAEISRWVGQVITRRAQV